MNPKWVVVSPHLDDGVLSLGATISNAVRSGTPVEVLTVFSGDAASTEPAREWDRRSGFRTEGEATLKRQSEDEAACCRVGAQSVWLPFRDSPYDAERDESEIWSAVAEAVETASVVLLPGFPLTNSDHAWLSELLLRRPLPCGRVALYAEQPYRYWVRKRQRRLAVPASVQQHVGQPTWSSSRGGIADWHAKLRALHEYRSQLPLLRLTRSRGLALYALLVDEISHGGEAIAWSTDLVNVPG